MRCERGAGQDGREAARKEGGRERARQTEVGRRKTRTRTESKTRGVAGVIDCEGTAAGEPYESRVGKDFGLEIPVAATQANARGGVSQTI